ncbi:MAG: SDR family oxidoreductase [Dehalococcoidia bacterium]|nr:SDR family oxidoreductase [Dehalococcoidia bacterium]
MPMTGRVALITGGGRGIGKGVALCLARDGANIAINYANDRASAEATQREVEALGRTARVYQCDISTGFEPVRAMVDQAAADFGRLDILVNNAGALSSGLTIHDGDVDGVRKVMDLNYWGAFYCTKAAIPHLRQQPRGDLIFVSAIIVERRSANRLSYAASKLAMEGLASVAAKEERRHGIRSNVVRPGLVATDMADEVGRRVGINDVSTLGRLAPYGRLCRPDDVGNTVAFLCSDAGEYINGAVIQVDGGDNDWWPRPKA